MKVHLILYDRRQLRPPGRIVLGNGDLAYFLSGSEPEHYLYGMRVDSVVPALDEWPAGLARAIRERMI